MSDMTADKLAQRIVRAGLLDGRQIESVWAELQTRDVPLQAFVTLLLRKNLLTNYQVDRLGNGAAGPSSERCLSKEFALTNKACAVRSEHGLSQQN